MLPTRTLGPLIPAFLLLTSSVQASQLCIQGCCDMKLMLDTPQLPLVDADATSAMPTPIINVELGQNSIRCCGCIKNEVHGPRNFSMPMLGDRHPVMVNPESQHPLVPDSEADIDHGLDSSNTEQPVESAPAFALPITIPVNIINLHEGQLTEWSLIPKVEGLIGIFGCICNGLLRRKEDCPCGSFA